MLDVLFYGRWWKDCYLIFAEITSDGLNDEISMSLSYLFCKRRPISSKGISFHTWSWEARDEPSTNLVTRDAPTEKEQAVNIFKSLCGKHSLPWGFYGQSSSIAGENSQLKRITTLTNNCLKCSEGKKLSVSGLFEGKSLSIENFYSSLYISPCRPQRKLNRN